MGCKFEFFILRMMSVNPQKKTFSKPPKTFLKRPSTLQFGYYAIKSCKFGRIKFSESNYIIRFLEKYTKSDTNSKKVRIWNRITINYTLTKLSSESRMGKGKGPVVDYFTYVYPGQILFEFEKIPIQSWIRIFIKLQRRISLKIKFIQKK